MRTVSSDLIAMTYAERVAQPCIGHERADLVLAGCAILEALLRIWPCQRLRVADRGLREGILATLMAEDGHDRSARQRQRGTGSASANAARFARPGGLLLDADRAGAGREAGAGLLRQHGEDQRRACRDRGDQDEGEREIARHDVASRHGPCAATSSTSAPMATPADSDSCCATLAKLVARLIALVSISA